MQVLTNVSLQPFNTFGIITWASFMASFHNVQELQEALGTEDVACVIDAKHLCVNSRGIKDIESSTVTSEFGGKFKDDKVRREFLDYIKLETHF